MKVATLGEARRGGDVTSVRPIRGAPQCLGSQGHLEGDVCRVFPCGAPVFPCP